MKKLLILFLGVGYGFNHPLLYYADSVYEAKGYERKYMNYQEIFFDAKMSFEEKATKVREYVWEQAKYRKCKSLFGSLWTTISKY